MALMYCKNKHKLIAYMANYLPKKFKENIILYWGNKREGEKGRFPFY